MVKVLGWYFPWYSPIVILLWKWAVLLNARILSPENVFVDLPLAALTFDIWAITSKMKHQPIRVDGEEVEGEWALVLLFSFFHLTLYVLSVRVWLVVPSLIWRLVVTGLILLFMFGPYAILGRPAEIQQPN